MNDAEILIEQLLRHYNVSRLEDLAPKLGVLRGTISGWKTRNSVSAIKKKMIEIGLDIDIVLQRSSNAKLQNLLNDSLQLGANPEEIQAFLEKTTVLAKIKQSLKHPAQEPFWKEVIDVACGRGSPWKALLILERVIKEAEPASADPKTAKEVLKKMITDYKLKLAKDKLQHFITEADKKRLLKMVDEFDDAECYNILYYSEETAQVIDESLPVELRVTPRVK